MTWSDELQTAIEAAREAGRMIRERFREHRQIQHKGPANLVTEIDLLSEQMISERLLRAFPDYGIFGEEGKRANAQAERVWVIDPLDGTTNYAHGYPHFGVSIALAEGRQSVVGVVYQPLLDELFAAARGNGATLNGVPITVSETTNIALALVASGFPYDVWTNNNHDNLTEWGRLAKQAISMRSDGVASLDLCFVAAGRLDVYWELDLEAWDMAAGALIVEEAGGRVTPAEGGDFTPFQRSVLASNGHLHEAMLALINPS